MKDQIGPIILQTISDQLTISLPGIFRPYKITDNCLPCVTPEFGGILKQMHYIWLDGDDQILVDCHGHPNYTFDLNDPNFDCKNIVELVKNILNGVKNERNSNVNSGGNKVKNQ